jgi:hypothetical protein
VLYNPYTKKTICLLAFFWAAIRYLYIRWELSGISDPPDYLDTVHEHSELCITFKQWLENNDLMALATLFQFPITMMGYGQFEDIAAPYALRYMSLRTFFPMVFGAVADHLVRRQLATALHRRVPAAVGTGVLADRRPAQREHHQDRAFGHGCPDQLGSGAPTRPIANLLIHIKLTRRRRGSRNGIADFPSKCYLGLFSL